MTQVAFIMRAHPRQEDACLVSGAVKSPFRLLRSLRERVHVVGVLVVDQTSRFVTHGYPVIGLRVRGLRLYPRTLVWNVLTFPLVVRLFARAQIVQCHHPHFGLGAAVARRLLFPRVRLIVKAHGTAAPELAANRYPGLKGRVLAMSAAALRRHDRWVLQSADRCLVSSVHQEREMVEVYGVGADRLRTIYNGVDAQHVRVRDRRGSDAVDAPRFVFVGRVVPKKGHAQLFRLYEGVRAVHPGATLTLVLGHRDAVEDSRTHDLILEAARALPGCRLLYDLDEPGLYDVLAHSDIGLVPSEGYESIPSVVLEMGAAGLPVFATYRWGIPEVLPEDLGLTGDADADVARISEFIQTRLGAWDSPAWAHRHERFHYDRLADRYCEVYAELLEPRGA